MIGLITLNALTGKPFGNFSSNYSANQTKQVNAQYSVNNSFTFSNMFGSRSNNESKVNESFSEKTITPSEVWGGFVSFVKAYYIYFIIGFVILVLVIAAFELFMVRKDEGSAQP